MSISMRQREEVMPVPYGSNRTPDGIVPTRDAPRQGEGAGATYLLGEVGHGWEIIQPLPIPVMSDDDGSYVVSDDLFAVYGVGGTSPAARRDYLVALTEFYQLVLADAERCEPHSQRLFRHLRTYLRRQSAWGRPGAGCERPCDPNTGCPDCAEYWTRMEHEGFWDRSQHQWTDKGWREMLK